MNQNDKEMSMCMEVAGIESMEGLNVGPRRVNDGGVMHDSVHTADGSCFRRAASGCEAIGMDAD